MNIILNLAILFLYVLSFIVKSIFITPSSETSFYSPNKFVDSYVVADYYNYVFYIECLLNAVVFVKILNFLKLNDYIKLFYVSIFIGMEIMFKYFIFVLLILLGFSSIAHILWGPFLTKYSTFGGSFLNMLLFSAL